MTNSSASEKQFPFNCPSFDPETTNGSRVQELLANNLRFSDTSAIDFFEIEDERRRLTEGISQADGEKSNVLLRPSDSVPKLKVILIPQERGIRRPYGITRPFFEAVVKRFHIPIRFIEVLANNNGGYYSFLAYSEDGTSIKNYHMAVKFPNSLQNLAIYFRYHVSNDNVFCIAFGQQIEPVKAALSQIFPTIRPRQKSSSQVLTDPFKILEVITSETLAWMESERQKLDLEVRALETKTGMSGHHSDGDSRLEARYMGELISNLHKCGGQSAFFQRMCEFQARWIHWLRCQHSWVNEIRTGTSDVRNMDAIHRPAVSKVAASLDLGASFATERHEQVKTLSNRIKIQLSIAANLNTQNDTQNNIAIAEASRRIALETRLDSDAMKTIAALTMAYLPGTFVATLFGMVFFNVGSNPNSKFSVNDKWWIYLAATIPLTILTVSLWLGWVKYKRSRRKKFEGSIDWTDKRL